MTLSGVLVEGGGEQCSPRGDPGPGQVAVAADVYGALVWIARVRAALGRGGVGDPPLREPAERVAWRGPPAGPLGHQAATGESGSSRGSTTDSGCLTTSPLAAGSARSRRSSRSRCRPGRSRRRHRGRRPGSHRAPGRGARAAASRATAHRLLGLVLVDHDDQGHHHAHRRAAGAGAGAAGTPRAIPAGVGIQGARSWSGPPPGSAVAGQHLVGRLRTPAAGGVGLRLPASCCPRLEDRVEDLPGAARPPRCAGRAAGRPAARRG